MKTAILKEMIGRIQEDNGFLIVKADQEGAKVPPLPYATYKVTSPYIKGRGRGAFTQFVDEGSGAAYEKFTEQPLTTISFNVFADDVDEARELAIQLRNWFTFAGTPYLQDRDIVVRSAGNVENRTTHLIDHYEYKHGFDVQLRTEEEQVRLMTESIETIEIGG
ncbi:LIC_12616 family protein [Bacillus badius]|uniref:Phage neck terminator protein gp12-like domain-containing protein n=1 Tax=Bacillus badius TaxID=1455 RepID=A0ABR5ANW2_BACBA|nr:hypothetical protein [Bacillus badius]KIL72719.1 hypothetical protein SD77_3454 [Bacillus badius]MED4715434.1 hypothetical protein [Bacillus badius]